MEGFKLSVNSVGEWMNFTTPEEIVKFYEENNFSTRDKWTAFKWFASQQGKEEVFRKLLNPEFFPPEEVVKKYFYNGSINRFVDKDAVDKYVEDALKREVFSLVESGKLTEVKIIKLIEHYYTKDKDMTLYILDNANPEFVYNKYFVKQDDFGASVKALVEKHRKNIALNGAFAVYASNLQKDQIALGKLKLNKDFNDWNFFELLGTTKGTEKSFERLIALNIINPEHIKVEFSDKKLKKFHESLDCFLKGETWKAFNDAEFIYDTTPKDRRWECFEYLIENNPTVAKSFMTNYEEFYVSKVRARYIGANLDGKTEQFRDFIAELMRNYDQQKEHGLERRSRIKADIMLDHGEAKKVERWIGADQEFKQWFSLANGFRLKGRKDFSEISQKFLESDLTVESFCDKYKVSSVAGFKNMLHVMGEESPDFRDALMKKGEVNKSKNLAQTRKLVEAVVVGKISVEDLINNTSNSLDLGQLIEFIDKTYNNPKVTQIFARRVIIYYYGKLNSYDLSTDPENINKMLTLNDVKFFTGENEFAKIVRLGRGDLASLFQGQISSARPGMEKVFETQVYGAGNNKILNRLKFYDNRFKPKDALGSVVGSIGGAEIKVTKEVLDNVGAYIGEQRLYPSANTAQRIIRAMAEGKIELRTDVSRKYLLDDVLEDADKCGSLQEYFELIEQTETCI